MLPGVEEISVKAARTPALSSPAPPQNLDLTKRRMVHEGPLSWKVNKDKTIGL